MDNKHRTTKFIQATTELVEKAGVTKLLDQLESVVETKADGRTIKEIMEKADSNLRRIV